MKLSNAVAGLQVFVRTGLSRTSASFVQGKVGIISAISVGGVTYELQVKFADGKADVMNACDVRKAKVTDAGAVVKIGQYNATRSEYLGSIQTVVKDSSNVPDSITTTFKDGWTGFGVGTGKYWHVAIENVSLVSTVSDFMSAPKA